MNEVRRSDDRGYADHGWLKSFHSFSFADYFDPEHIEFGPLRVINEDRVQAGQGFGTHAHKDMEIISYVLSGALAHQDSMGTKATILPGEVQRMSAGTGVLHSEFNHDKGTTHFLQIWIIPDRNGVKPSYEQKAFADADKRGRLRLVVSPDGEDGSVTIHQDAKLFAGLFDAGETAEHPLGGDRLGYVHLVRGTAVVNGRPLKAGDALLLQDERAITIGDGADAEVLVFDLPPMPLS